MRTTLVNSAQYRRRLCLFLVGTGALVATLVEMVPARGFLMTIAGLFLVVGVPGLLGINVFRGSPLDTRFDSDAPAQDVPPITSIVQRRGLERRRADLYPDSVLYTLSSLFLSQQFRVRFEETLQDPVWFTEPKSRNHIYRAVVLGLGLLFLFLTATGERENFVAGLAISAFCLSVAGFGWLFDYFPRKPLVQLSGGNPALVLLSDRPTSDIVNEFISELQACSQAYIRANYGAQAGHMPIDQIERLAALLQQGAISEAEFNELKASVLLDPSEASVGQYL